MTRTKKPKKSPVDVALDDAFRRLGNGVQINVMDLTPMFDYARQRVVEVIEESPAAVAILARDGIVPQMLIDLAMNSAIAKYRKN